jgi:hypothetical protein
LHDSGVSSWSVDDTRSAHGTAGVRVPVTAGATQSGMDADRATRGIVISDSSSVSPSGSLRGSPCAFAPFV